LEDVAMTELQKYLAEEVAEDHADGLINRREAMRRLGLLGVSGAAASALLAGFAAGSAAARSAVASGGDRDTPTTLDWAPGATEAISFPGPRGTLLGAWAPAEDARAGVLVIHENRGLTDHIKMVAARFAADGFSALAIDLLSEEGGTDSFADPAEVGAVLASVPPERFDEDMQAGVTELQRRLPGKKITAIGFCFGGGMVWRLLTIPERRLAAAAPFYGPFPAGASAKGSRAAVLGVYGGLDDRVNATRAEARAALEDAGLEHLIATFGIANHAFFNDTGQRFEPASAAEAWRRAVAWFEEHAAG
jgi:carboxymethylenebutenolidase